MRPGSPDIAGLRRIDWRAPLVQEQKLVLEPRIQIRATWQHDMLVVSSGHPLCVPALTRLVRQGYKSALRKMRSER